MIKKTLLAAFVLTAIYSFGIMRLKPAVQISQHQWQDNMIKAQNFIYNEENDTIENVIVGSSLSCRLVMDSLAGYTNLSFSGQSIFDGLNILSHKKKLPENIFIETNIILRNEDKNFTASLTNPFLYNMRLIVPSLREGKQPLGIAGQDLAYVVGGILSRLKNTAAGSVSDKGMADQHSDLFRHILQNEISNFSRIPSVPVLKQSFDNLEKYVTGLRRRGANIIFFEMPVNRELCGLPESVAVREGFYKRFPSGPYHYITQPDCSYYTTTDGLHLNNTEAIHYTRYFLNSAKLYN